MFPFHFPFQDELNEQEDSETKHRNGTVKADDIQDTDLFHSFLVHLVDQAVDGFYVQDSESTNLEWQNEVLKSFTKLSETEQDILFGIDSSLALNSSVVSLTGVELDASCISTAQDLDQWMENLLFSMPHRTILWKVPQEEISGLNQINTYLNFFGLVLPGIPVLERRHLEQLREDKSNTVSFMAVSFFLSFCFFFFFSFLSSCFLFSLLLA